MKAQNVRNCLTDKEISARGASGCSLAFATGRSSLESQATSAADVLENQHSESGKLEPVQFKSISFFTDAFQKEPAKALPLSDFLNGIKSGTWEKDIAPLRGLLAENKRGDYDSRKRTLAGATLSVHCLSRGSSLTYEQKAITHSGWLQADFDLKDNPILATQSSEKRRDLLADPHVCCVFVGPSGEGLKAVVAIPADYHRHKAAWLAAEAHFRDVHGLALDKATKDPMRLCFVSHDPNLATSQVFEPLPVPEATPEKVEQPAPEDSTPHPENPAGWIILPSGHIGNYDSAVTLFSAMKKAGRFFLRGDRTCEVQEIEGSKRVEITKDIELVSTCETLGVPVAVWGKDDKNRPVLRPGARANRSTTGMWLESNVRQILPTIKSIISCPALMLEGDNLIVLPPGYHEPSGTMVDADFEIDAGISHQEALDALELLLRDFDFVTPSDRARALAMLLTPALVPGGLLRGHIPVFGVEANASQTGKGYLCELVQSVYAETPSTVGRKEGGVGSFDESLAAALIYGRPFIQIDNVRGKLASQFFEMVLTCQRGATIGCRIPRRPEVQIDPSRVIFHITSNGLEMTEDLANRACITRIRKREKWNPPRFPEGGLVEHVAANRARFLGAVFHLIARWVEEGRPQTEDTRAPGRFRAWGQALDWIVQNLVGCPPLLDGHEQVQQRMASPGLVWVRDIGTRIIATNPDRANPWTASNIVEFAVEQGIPIPGCKDEVNEDAAARAVGRIMGRLLGSQSEVQADDILVRREETQSEREDGNGFRILKTYRFNNLPLNPPQSPQWS
jgi:hypothetical protein